jgi:hypothetical protein
MFGSNVNSPHRPLSTSDGSMMLFRTLGNLLGWAGLVNGRSQRIWRGIPLQLWVHEFFDSLVDDLVAVRSAGFKRLFEAGKLLMQPLDPGLLRGLPRLERLRYRVTETLALIGVATCIALSDFLRQDDCLTVELLVVRQ